jgi:ferredoxin
VIHCREFYALIEELFTPEEAELASKMPLGLVSAADMAKETGGDTKVADELLESMANKGLLFSYQREGVWFYELLVLLPGMFEAQFTKGEVDERAKRLAHLFEDYFNVMTQLREKAGPRGAASIAPIFPFSRVVIVEKEIPGGIEIQPYDRISQYIAKAPYISVGTCYCRHFGELLGRPCDKPKQNCMGLGPAAVFTAGRGFGRLVSKEEALEIVKRAEEAGLVHCISNTGKYVDFICNCCTCHCGILRSLKDADSPSMAATSSFIASLDKGDCSDCGDCLERCPMDALTIEGDEVTLDSNRCIGCGLCVSVCPTGAIKLEPREGAPVPPRDRHELNAAMMSSMRPKT